MTQESISPEEKEERIKEHPMGIAPCPWCGRELGWTHMKAFMCDGCGKAVYVVNQESPIEEQTLAKYY